MLCILVDQEAAKRSKVKVGGWYQLQTPCTSGSRLAELAIFFCDLQLWPQYFCSLLTFKNVQYLIWMIWFISVWSQKSKIVVWLLTGSIRSMCPYFISYRGKWVYLFCRRFISKGWQLWLPNLFVACSKHWPSFHEPRSTILWNIDPVSNHHCSALIPFRAHGVKHCCHGCGFRMELM